jgi:hypothetical protein
MFPFVRVEIRCKAKLSRDSFALSNLFQILKDYKKATLFCARLTEIEYIHLIKAIQGNRFQIANNRGRINGWIGTNSIFGKCVKIED